MVIDLGKQIDRAAGSKEWIEAACGMMGNLKFHRGIEKDVNLADWVFRNRRFNGRIKVDKVGGAVFPHYDGGICGYEVYKGRSFAGEKGIWMSNAFPKDDVLVVASSPVEALAHFAIYEPLAAWYVSGGRTLSDRQKSILGPILSDWDGHVLAAVDCDAEGRQLAADIQSLSRSDVCVRMPESHRSWSDWLRSRTGFPHAPCLLPE